MKPNENSYRSLELAVLEWGQARGITLNGTAMGQAIKTMEESVELVSALNERNISKVRDAIGDVVVTLIFVAELAGLDLVQCLAAAYDEIKDRKGYMTPGGVFVKEAT